MVGSVYLLHVFSGLSGPGLVCLSLVLLDCGRLDSSMYVVPFRVVRIKTVSECNDEINHVIVLLTHVIP